MEIRESRCLKKRVIQRMKKRIRIIILGILLLLSLLCFAFLLYTGIYYHADASALAALESDETVQVTQTGYGWLFDGPSEKEAFIFYPGAKVEETAYAPLLHRIAEQGMDACLVSMPFRLAVFGVNKAGQVIRQHDYDSWYIGGHSLGGAMAANYAAGNPEKLAGVVLLGAYSTKDLKEDLSVISIYGSEDGVLNRTRMQEYERCLPENCGHYVIAGGNHAQFGSYGKQNGDGEASISAKEQQDRTAELILGMKRQNPVHSGSPGPERPS